MSFNISGGFRGTTSACAENTTKRMPPHADSRNYLRVRGEYPVFTQTLGLYQELPPRARRIQFVLRGVLNDLGTTSACAENTPATGHGDLRTRNYLRVRGEYPLGGCGFPDQGELPPRARRILPNHHKQYRTNGTTSACAENTTSTAASETVEKNYLRVRGEYNPILRHIIKQVELPPRARRIQVVVG